MSRESLTAEERDACFVIRCLSLIGGETATVMAHQEHPRPGTVAWLVKRVAYECGITTGVVEVEEDTREDP